jgi:hypothetical protein
MSEPSEPSEPNLEDSMNMEELEIEIKEESTLTTYEKEFDQVDKMLAQAINLNNESELHESTCPICCSPLRQEAEDIWDRSAMSRDVISVFREKSSQKINATLVKNHMKNHKDRGISGIKKVEYIDRLRRLHGSNSSTTLDKLNLAMAMVMDQILEINSLEPSGDKSIADIKKIISTETNRLSATYGNMVKLQATLLGEMKDSGEVITISQDKFVTVFNDALADAKNDREREIITRILSGLK